jgi:hypothetical protein
MSAKRHQLTPAIEQAIVAYIRAGSFPHVAAEAAGVPAEVFERWLAQGDKPRAAARYRNFAQAVRQAVAQARLAAEVETRTSKPLDWLRGGPGRPTSDSAGWTGPARAPTAAPDQSPFLSPEIQQLFAALLEALAPYPEARAAAAAVLDRLSTDSAPKRSHRRPSRP